MIDFFIDENLKWSKSKWQYKRKLIKCFCCIGISMGSNVEVLAQINRGLMSHQEAAGGGGEMQMAVWWRYVWLPIIYAQKMVCFLFINLLIRRRRFQNSFEKDALLKIIKRFRFNAAKHQKKEPCSGTRGLLSKSFTGEKPAVLMGRGILVLIVQWRTSGRGWREWYEKEKWREWQGKDRGRVVVDDKQSARIINQENERYFISKKCWYKKIIYICIYIIFYNTITIFITKLNFFSGKDIRILLFIMELKQSKLLSFDLSSDTTALKK